MTFEVPSTIRACPVALSGPPGAAAVTLAMPSDLAAVWRAGERPTDALAYWPARPEVDGEPADVGDLSTAQRDALTAWVTEQRRAIAVAYGFEDAGDLAAFGAGLFGLATDTLAFARPMHGAEPGGEPLSDHNRLSRRAEALGPAWSMIRDYAPAAPGDAKATALSRLARFLADTSPGLQSEDVGGSWSGGEGQAVATASRKLAYGRADRPLAQSGAAAVLARWRVMRAGAIG